MRLTGSITPVIRRIFAASTTWPQQSPARAPNPVSHQDCPEERILLSGYNGGNCSCYLARDKRLAPAGIMIE